MIPTKNEIILATCFSSALWVQSCPTLGNWGTRQPLF